MPQALLINHANKTAAVVRSMAEGKRQRKASGKPQDFTVHPDEDFVRRFWLGDKGYRLV